MTQPTVDQLVTTALAFLGTQDGVVTGEALQDAAEKVAAWSPAIDVQEIIWGLEERVTVHVRPAVTLSKDHQPWLGARSADIEWRFWDRYRDWLMAARGFPEKVVTELDHVTDNVLDLIADPGGATPFDRRGLVVGQVQSGKTANYLGLIAKGIDAGFRVVIVLAGAHNDLRAQTQLRIDEGLLGWDTNVSRDFVNEDHEDQQRIGVGRMPQYGLLPIRPLTSSAINGDFSVRKAQVRQLIGADPLILVIKKNKSVLENVQKWLTELDAREAADGVRRIPDHGLLVIDDEADHYSVNTRKAADYDDETDPTTINRLIRSLLNRFEKRAYVGYTATAFANIFIGTDIDHAEYGEDLFPSSFIVNIRPPSNYVGAAKVFGLEGLDGADDVEPIPVVRELTDAEDWIPSRHQKDHVVGPLPASLKEAIRSFIIGIAVRRARGHEGAHHSMLVHVSRLNAIQDQVTEYVRRELDDIRNEIRYGTGAGGTVLAELKELWDRDHSDTSKKIAQQGVIATRDVVSWPDVKKQLRAAVVPVQVRTVNGMAKDALEYYEHRHDGLSIIAIGGNKLSRGLTLEGLTVSYYLRASRAYDTLLQMGRWFGYRPGYADVCRLYTTPLLHGWYRDITLANAELMADLDHMAAIGATPMEFGLRVRRHPDGLLISNPNKLRNAETIRLNFSQTLTETVVFDRSIETRHHNLDATARLVTGLGDSASSSRRTDHRVWSDVDGEVIADYLDEVKTSSSARRARTDLLGQYVRSRMRSDELVDWTVVLTSIGTGRRATIGDLEIGLVQRAGNVGRGKVGAPLSDEHHYRTKRLLSGPDEATDLDPKVVKEANRKAEECGGFAPTFWREARSKRRGLLLIYPLDPVADHLEPLDDPQDVELPYIGLGISLPRSDDHYGGVEYSANQIMMSLEIDDA